MKIFNFGLLIQPGKYKYNDSSFDKLVEKFSPKKVSPYTVEFVDTDLELAEAVVYDFSKKLDFVFIDLEKIEKRVERSEDSKEKLLLAKAQEILEKEQLLSEAEFTEEDKNVFRTLQLVTIKPAVVKKEAGDVSQLIAEVIETAGIILFFTAGKKEVHAWNVKKGENVLEAAGKIHSDLKRGFIKAEVTNCRDLDNFFNMAEAKSRGFTKVVDRDYIMETNDIIDVRFSV